MTTNEKRKVFKFRYWPYNQSGKIKKLTFVCCAVDQWLLSWCALLCPRDDDICCLCGMTHQEIRAMPAAESSVSRIDDGRTLCPRIWCHARALSGKCQSTYALYFREKNVSKFVSGRLVLCLIWFKRCGIFVSHFVSELFVLGLPYKASNGHKIRFGTL